MKYSILIVIISYLFGNCAKVQAQDQADKYNIRIGFLGTTFTDATYRNNVNFSEDSLMLVPAIANTRFSPVFSLRFERIYRKNTIWTSSVYFNSQSQSITVVNDVYDSSAVHSPFIRPNQNLEKIIEVKNRVTNIAVSTGLLWQTIKKEKSRLNLNIGPSVDVQYYNNQNYYFDQLTTELLPFEEKGIAFGLDGMLDFSFQITPSISIGMRYSLNLVQGNINLANEDSPSTLNTYSFNSSLRSKEYYRSGAALELGYRF